MRILVVDDDERLLRAMQRSLPGHDVSIETDPLTAIACVETADVDGEPFEAVVCDFKMPGMSGLDVFARLRDAVVPPLLLLMTGDDDVADAAAIADGVLIKPFRIGEVVEAVERVRANRRRIQTRRLRRTPASTAKIPGREP